MNLPKEIQDSFQETQTVFLSTVSGDEPRVRPVILIYYESTFWIATGYNDAKIRQIKVNNNIEFCLPFDERKEFCYIRVTGKAQIVQDISEKRMLLENIDFLKEYWQQADDPTYALLRIDVREIEYLRVNEMLAVRQKI
ncbi:MAG TPA: pyridoxamine 5'-phosphate oxidase family protein [Candidatus Cloacimonadota bacterium]|nr:pyridoxamine 5'-phosphate oxidase family protein [Candidatus Cloacimonadota bacterium]